jgi:hypothetical protein
MPASQTLLGEGEPAKLGSKLISYLLVTKLARYQALLGNAC